MKETLKKFLMIAVLAILSGCGGAASTTDTGTETEEGALITGTIETSGVSALSKSAGSANTCIGDICAMVAYNSDGTETRGELVAAENQFRIRARNGNWMFGFLDGGGERLGYMEMNGVTSFLVEDAEDVDIGTVINRGGHFISDNDVESLGEYGFYSYRKQDSDRDGIPLAFDSDEFAIDTSEFDVLFVRPYNEQVHVAPCRPIKAVFTKALDESSVTAETVIISLSDGSTQEGELSVWEDAEYSEYEITFAPSGGYAIGEIISVKIVSGPDGVLSKESEELESDVEISFAVRDYGGSGSMCHDPDSDRQRLREQNRNRNGGN